jgi:hypothetical protein
VTVERGALTHRPPSQEQLLLGGITTNVGTKLSATIPTGCGLLPTLLHVFVFVSSLLVVTLLQLVHLKPLKAGSSACNCNSHM